MEGRERTLRVGNISAETSPHDLRTLFSKVGPVSSLRIHSDLPTIAQAFVSMSEEGAAAALESFEGRRWRGRRMTVRKYPPSYQEIEEDEELEWEE